MGQKFAEKARLADHVGYDPASMEATFRFLIEHSDCCLFVSENGAIGGAREPHPFNVHSWKATELFWWSEGRDGLRLLAAFEEWAAEKCQMVEMMALEAVDPERTGKLYERRGYAPVERGFVKVL